MARRGLILAPLLVALVAGCQDPYRQDAERRDDVGSPTPSRERPRGDDRPPLAREHDTAPAVTSDAQRDAHEPPSTRSARSGPTGAGARSNASSDGSPRLATGRSPASSPPKRGCAPRTRRCGATASARAATSSRSTSNPARATRDAVCVTWEEQLANGRADAEGARHRVYLATIQRTRERLGGQAMGTAAVTARIPLPNRARRARGGGVRARLRRARRPARRRLRTGRRLGRLDARVLPRPPSGTREPGARAAHRTRRPPRRPRRPRRPRHAALPVRGSPSASPTGRAPAEPFVEIEPGLRLVASAPGRGADAEPEHLSALLRDARAAHGLVVVDCGTELGHGATGARRGDAHPLDRARPAETPSRARGCCSPATPSPRPGARASSSSRSPRTGARRASVRALRRLAAQRCERLVLARYSDAVARGRPRRPVGRPRPDAHRHRPDPSERPDDRPRRPLGTRARPRRRRALLRGRRDARGRVWRRRGRAQRASPTTPGAPCASTSPASSRRPPPRCGSHYTTPGSSRPRCSARRSFRDYRSPLGCSPTLVLAVVLAANAGLVGVALGAYGARAGRCHRAASAARVRRALARRRRIHACTPTAARPPSSSPPSRRPARCCSSSPRRSRPTSPLGGVR